MENNNSFTFRNSLGIKQGYLTVHTKRDYASRPEEYISLNLETIGGNGDIISFIDRATMKYIFSDGFMNCMICNIDSAFSYYTIYDFEKIRKETSESYEGSSFKKEFYYCQTILNNIRNWHRIDKKYFILRTNIFLNRVESGEISIGVTYSYCFSNDKEGNFKMKFLRKSKQPINVFLDIKEQIEFLNFLANSKMSI